MSSVEKLSSKCIKENISFGVWEPEIGVNLSNSWHCFGGYKQSLRTRISMWDIIIFCFFYCHIRKVILSIVEEHSCTVYAAPLTANGTNKKQFFSLQKARSMSSTGQKKTKKNKGQNIQTLQNRVVKENHFNKEDKIKKYAAVQLCTSLRGKFFYEPLSTFTEKKKNMRRKTRRWSFSTCVRIQTGNTSF